MISYPMLGAVNGYCLYTALQAQDWIAATLLGLVAVHQLYLIATGPRP